jgi:hypothetical protein
MGSQEAFDAVSSAHFFDGIKDQLARLRMDKAQIDGGVAEEDRSVAVPEVVSTEILEVCTRHTRFSRGSQDAK